MKINVQKWPVDFEKGVAREDVPLLCAVFEYSVERGAHRSADMAAADVVLKHKQVESAANSIYQWSKQTESASKVERILPWLQCAKCV